MKKNTASQVIGAQMCSATDGSAFTGSVTVYVTGDAGTQAAGSVGSGACTHEGNGFHTYAPSQAETNYDHVAFTFVGTGAVPATVQVYPTFPQTGDSYARLGAPAGASVSADVAAVQSDTNDIQTRLPAALVSGRIDASVGAMASGVLTATAIADDAITDAKVASDVTIASVTGAVGSIATGGITAASFAAGAIDASAIAADAIGSSELAASAASEIASAVRTELTTELGRVDVAVSTRAAASDLVTVASYIDTEIGDIQSRLPAALVSGRMDSSVGAMAANVVTASAVADGAIDRAALAADTGLQSVRSNTAQAGASTSITLDASASATTDFYVNHLVLLTGGTGAGQARYITGYNGTTKVATVTAWATNPDNTSTFALLAGDAIPGATAPTASQVADAVWDEILSGHAVSGSAGEAMAAAGSAGDPWSTALPGSYGAGTAGKIIGDNINATIGSRASQTSVDTVDDFLDTEVAAIKAKTDNLPADPADASDIAASFSTVNSTLSTLSGYIDTEVAAILAAVDTEVGAIKAKTDNLPAAPAAVGDIPTAVENADALLNRDMSTGTDSGSPTVRTVRQALRALRNKWTMVGTTYTVMKEDDSTTSWTSTVSTTSGADPITGSDPA